MTAPWTVRPRCRPLRRRRAPGWHIRASRRSGGGAGSQGGAPSGALRRRRTRAGGRPPVGSGSRHGPDRLHRFQKYRGRAGRGAAEAAVPAVISSPAHCGAPGSWTFARKSPDRAGAAEKGAAAARRPPAISVWILYHNICRPRIHFQSSVRTLHRGAIRVPLALRQRRGGTSGYGLCELTQGT